MTDVRGQNGLATIDDLSSQGVRPAISAETQPFWDALANGEIIVEQCPNCALHNFPPRGLCRRCLHRGMDRLVVEPPGVIYSYTVNHHPWSPGNGIYAIAIVELPRYSGIRFVGFIDGLDREPRIGESVGFGISESLDGLPRIYFTPWSG